MATAVRAGQSLRADQLYLWIWGAALVVLGIASLVVNPDFATGDDVTGEHFFGVVETNGWHGVTGLMFGVLALAFARSYRWGPLVAAIVGGGAGVVPAIVYFIVGDGNVALGLIPVDLRDGVALHLVPGLIGLACSVIGTRQRLGD